MNRQQMLEQMRALENLQAAGELDVRGFSELEYLRVQLYPLAVAEMTDDELAQYYDGEFDEPSPKYGMRMSGKGTRRVHAVLSGRAIY